MSISVNADSNRRLAFTLSADLKHQATLLATSETPMCKTIKQRVKFKAPPATVYDLLADSSKHSTNRSGLAPPEIPCRRLLDGSHDPDVKAYLAEAS